VASSWFSFFSYSERNLFRVPSWRASDTYDFVVLCVCNGHRVSVGANTAPTDGVFTAAIS